MILFIIANKLVSSFFGLFPPAAPTACMGVGVKLGQPLHLSIHLTPTTAPHTHTHCFLPSPALAGTARLVTHTGAIIAEGDLHSVTIQPVSCTFITFPRPWMLAPLPLSLSFIRGPGPLLDNGHSASSCLPELSGPRGQTVSSRQSPQHVGEREPRGTFTPQPRAQSSL